MKGTCMFFVAILATTSAFIPLLRCPKIQIINWNIELLLPHKECDKFYQCTHGKPIVRSCPSGLLYNIRARQCDWPDNVGCTNRIIPTPKPPQESEESQEAREESASNSDEQTGNGSGNDSSQESEEEIEFRENGCPVDPLIHWLLPHEIECSYFYSCVWGRKVQRNCSSLLHFNKKEQVCDWPRNANCEILSLKLEELQ